MLNQEGFTRDDFRETIKEVCTARNRPTSTAFTPTTRETG